MRLIGVITHSRYRNRPKFLGQLEVTRSMVIDPSAYSDVRGSGMSGGSVYTYGGDRNTFLERYLDF